MAAKGANECREVHWYSAMWGSSVCLLSVFSCHSCFDTLFALMSFILR